MRRRARAEAPPSIVRVSAAPTGPRAASQSASSCGVSARVAFSAPSWGSSTPENAASRRARSSSHAPCDGDHAPVPRALARSSARASGARLGASSSARRSAPATTAAAALVPRTAMRSPFRKSARKPPTRLFGSPSRTSLERAARIHPPGAIKSGLGAPLGAGPSEEKGARSPGEPRTYPPASLREMVAPTAMSASAVAGMLIVSSRRT